MNMLVGISYCEVLKITLAIGDQFKNIANEVHPAIRLIGKKTHRFSDLSRAEELVDNIIIAVVKQ